MKEDDRIVPNQLWPDWGAKPEIETGESETIDPVELVQKTHIAIDFLNQLEISIINKK